MNQPLPAVHEMDRRALDRHARRPGPRGRAVVPSSSTGGPRDVAHRSRRIRHPAVRPSSGQRRARRDAGDLGTAPYRQLFRSARRASGRRAHVHRRGVRRQWAAAVAIVSHRLAQRFGGASAALGRQLRLNVASFTVVGVAPADFAGTYAGLSFDLLGAGDDAAHVQRPARSSPEPGAAMASGHRPGARRQDGGGRAPRARVRQPPDCPAPSRRAAADAFVKPLDTGAAQRSARCSACCSG